MKVLESIRALEAHAAGPCVLVPTMGALHEGHAALVRQGAAIARAAGLRGGCLVTVFVNPTQFDSSTDFARYPKTIDADLALCKAAGAAAVFVPATADVYPPAPAPPVVVPPVPEVGRLPGLEDARRPGHFAGVCQVVLRLFQMTRPARAVFGEKDWQQLQVIGAMVRAQGLDLEIVPGPTVREHDGLAMSSRNRFLSATDRRRAPAINLALKAASTQPTPARAERRMQEVLSEQGITPDYAVVRHATTLAPISWPLGPGVRTMAGPMRALIAAPVGTVRLIDNANWTPSASEPA